MGPNSKLALLGGIVINCDGFGALGRDLFLPLMFTLKSKNGQEEDIFNEVFKSEIEKTQRYKEFTKLDVKLDDSNYGIKLQKAMNVGTTSLK